MGKSSSRKLRYVIYYTLYKMDPKNTHYKIYVCATPSKTEKWGKISPYLPLRKGLFAPLRRLSGSLGDLQRSVGGWCTRAAVFAKVSECCSNLSGNIACLEEAPSWVRSWRVQRGFRLVRGTGRQGDSTFRAGLALAVFSESAAAPKPPFAQLRATLAQLKPGPGGRFGEEISIFHSGQLVW